MALNATALATAIKNGLGFGSQPTSTKNINMATDIVTHIKSGTVAFAPGTITGTAPPSGGPLSNGAGSNGTITLVSSALATAFIATFGHNTSQIAGLANAISTHIMTGTVKFDSGNITGVCANTPPPASAPGPLIGAGVGGKIVGLSGSGLASAIASGINQSTVSPQVLQMSTEIVNHIMNNAVVALPLVSGLCPGGGGSISLGAAAGGTIL
jgi:hypothetical protein